MEPRNYFLLPHGSVTSLNTTTHFTISEPRQEVVSVTRNECVQFRLKVTGILRQKTRMSDETIVTVRSPGNVYVKQRRILREKILSTKKYRKSEDGFIKDSLSGRDWWEGFYMKVEYKEKSLSCNERLYLYETGKGTQGTRFVAFIPDCISVS